LLKNAVIISLQGPAIKCLHTVSGAGTNLKSGGRHRSGAKVGGTSPARIAGKKFLVVPLYFFTLKVHLVVLVSAFVMVSFLFAVLLLTVPPCPAICKVGVRAPVPYELAPLHTDPPPQKNLELRQKTASDDFVCVN